MANFNEILELGRTIYGAPTLPKTVLIIEGESGIGKTQLAYELCKQLPDYTEPLVLSVPHLNLEDVGRTQMTEGGYLSFVFNQVFEPAPEGKKKLIVWDEWNRYENDAVGNFMMAITNERRIAGIKIDDSIRFMATQNPSSPDYSGTRPCTDLAETRRLNPVHMNFDPDGFLTWANQGLSQGLYQFLVQNPESILISGKINCPRQWERFDHDIIKNVDLASVSRTFLRMATLSYMNSATARLFMDYVDKQSEAMVTWSDLVKSPKKSKVRLEKLMNDNRQDLIMASAQDLKSSMENLKSIDDKQLEGFRLFCTTVQKSVAYTLLTQLADMKIYPQVCNFIMGPQGREIREILKSGVV